jgi:hypothetical protein
VCWRRSTIRRRSRGCSGARGARADRGGGRSVGVRGTAGCGRVRRRRRGQRCGVTVCGEVATAGRSLRGSGVLARRDRGGMRPGIGARGRVAAGLKGSRAVGRLAVVGPGWSGTGAWAPYARVGKIPEHLSDML